MIELKIGEKYAVTQLCEAYGKDKLRGGYLTNFIKQVEKDYKISKVNRLYKVERKWTDEEKQQQEAIGLYQKAIESVLSNILSQQHDYTCCFSTMELLIGLRMVTEDYKYCKYNICETALILDADVTGVEEYVKTSYEMLSTMLKRVLLKLNDKSLILYGDTFKLYNMYKGKMVNIVPATKEQESQLLKIRREVYNEIGVSGKSELYSNKRYLIDRYKSLCSIKCKSVLGFDGFFDAYQLTLNREGLKSNSAKMAKELNGKIKEKLETTSRLKGVEDLEKLIDATINPKRPYKLKENLLEHSYLNDESDDLVT